MWTLHKMMGPKPSALLVAACVATSCLAVPQVILNNTTVVGKDVEALGFQQELFGGKCISWFQFLPVQ